MTVNGTSTTSARPVVPRSTAAAPATAYARSVLLGMAGQEKIQPSHLQRLAVVYVRQSTPQQVLKNRESTDLQYQLARRAVQLGWSEDRVLVIDDDQAHTASTAEGRFGFQRLLAEVSLNHVGIVLGIEMSRLARSCKDWHGLLELCALFSTLLYDHDGVYDPAHYNDRLLLARLIHHVSFFNFRLDAAAGLWSGGDLGAHRPLTPSRMFFGSRRFRQQIAASLAPHLEQEGVRRWRQPVTPP